MVSIREKRIQEINAIATKLLERHNLLNRGNITLNTLIKSMGNITTRKSCLKGVDAFTCEYNGKYLICYDDKYCTARKRFSIAHEIGHIELNHFESEYTNEDWYRKKVDIEANYFAAALLIPSSFLIKYSTYTCEDITDKLMVSADSLRARVNTLDSLNDHQSFKFCSKCDSLIYANSPINFCSVCRNDIAI